MPLIWEVLNRGIAPVASRLCQYLLRITIMYINLRYLYVEFVSIYVYVSICVYIVCTIIIRSRYDSEYGSKDSPIPSLLSQRRMSDVPRFRSLPPPSTTGMFRPSESS